MTIVVPKADLDQALRAVKATSTRSTIPILSCCRLFEADGALALMTTNLDMWSTYAIESAEMPPGTDFCLAIDSLSAFVARLPPGDVQISEDGSVKSGRSRATISPLPGSDFPSPSTDDLPAPVSLDSDTADRLFSSVIVAVSNEEFRPYLRGVHLRNADGKITAEASDNKIAVSMESSIEAAIEPTILPTLAVKSALSSMNGEGIGISLGHSVSKLAVGQLQILTRNISGKFPEVERIKAQDPKAEIIVDRDQFIAAVQRVNGLTELSKDPANKIRGRLLSLTPKDDALAIESAVGGSTAAFDEIDAVISGEMSSVGFMAEYLLALASICPEGEISIGLTSPTTQASFIYEGMNGWSVVMPARV